MRKGTCKHFCGFQHKECDAGVSYLALAGVSNDGMALRLPCSGAFADRAKAEGIARVPCDKREEPTAEDLAEWEASMKRLSDRMKKTLPWISDMKQKHPRGVGHTVEKCPICAGLIHFTIAGYNGHMHAKCETKDCVSFME